MAGLPGYTFPKFSTTGYKPPTTTAVTPQYPLPGGTGTYQPPTPPPLPPPPTIPPLPEQGNTFLPLLQSILAQFQSYNPLPGLAPDILKQLGLATTAQKSNAELTFRDAFDKAIADLYGRNVERSTIATDATGRLSTEKANVMSQIEGQAADRELALRQFLGSQGLAALGQQANIAGSGAALEGQNYNSLVNAILGRAGLENQQYGIQSGQNIQEQQLAQQYALQQQQFLQSLLMQFLSGGIPGMSPTGGTTGGIPSIGFGGSTGGSPSSGVGGVGQIPVYQQRYDEQAQQYANNPYYQMLDQILYSIFGRHFFQ